VPAQHTLPLAEQAVLASRSVVPHTWFVQVAMVQVVAGQSAGVLHPATHTPLRSQTFPMLSSHAVNCAALVLVQQPLTQARVSHFVVVSGQSVDVAQGSAPRPHEPVAVELPVEDAAVDDAVEPLDPPAAAAAERS
jgi:hypothetical protein